MLLIAEMLTLLLMIKDCCRSAFFAIAIAIDGSRSSCSCCCRVPIAIALVGSCSGCIWREERIGKALDSRRVGIVVDDKELLPV